MYATDLKIKDAIDICQSDYVASAGERMLVDVKKNRADEAQRIKEEAAALQLQSKWRAMKARTFSMCASEYTMLCG